jgi:hypothetical protein
MKNNTYVQRAGRTLRRRAVGGGRWPVASRRWSPARGLTLTGAVVVQSRAEVSSLILRETIHLNRSGRRYASLLVQVQLCDASVLVFSFFFPDRSSQASTRVQAHARAFAQDVVRWSSTCPCQLGLWPWCTTFGPAWCTGLF